MNHKNKKLKEKDDFVAVLHNIRSLHNVGSIFRTADGAGVKKIYLCGITPTPVDNLGRPRQQLMKTSLGAEKSVKWEKASSTVKLLKKLKKDRYKILAAEQSKNSIPFYNYKIRGIRMNLQIRIAIVVGNEVNGLPTSVLKLADKILEIPMLGDKKSLNVSVAFGIVAYNLAVGKMGKKIKK